MTQRPTSLAEFGRLIDQDLSSIPSTLPHLSGASKTTVVDTDFFTPPPNGALCVHWDTSAARAYLSVRANGTWHVMAGPVA